MDWLRLFFLHPLYLYQGAAFPFAFLFNYLCSMDSFSTQARYLFLLAGGGALALAAMGPYAPLVLLPALGAVLLVSSLGPQEVHRWTFFFQMTWQTLCHLGLHYTEYYLREPPSPRFCITLSSLMLLTQRVTSLSLDISEGKVEAASGGIRSRSPLSAHLCKALPYFSYLLFFPALLGGPLCSFQRFRARVQGRSASRGRRWLWALTRKGLQVLGLEGLKVAVRAVVGAGPGLERCQRLQCVYAMWSAAGLFKLTYYSHWALDDCLLHAAGFASARGPGPDGAVWALETTRRLSDFARSWNRSSARWLRRLALGGGARWPRLRTFALSAWWHGGHPGQLLGFLCWAAAVEADHLPRAPAGPAQLRPLRRAVGWALAQLAVAFILLAVELRSPAALGPLCLSCNCAFPVLYCAARVLRAERRPGPAPRRRGPHGTAGGGAENPRGSALPGLGSRSR